MNAPHNQAIYPVWAFKRIAAAIEEVYGAIQAPMPMVALSFLSTMAAAVQRVADVRLPTGQIRPTSVFTLTIANSGERKTALDELVAKPLHQRDLLEEQRLMKQRQAFEIAKDRWQTVRSALTRRMSKLIEKGDSSAAIEQKLTDLDNSKPESIRIRRLVRQDLTYAAIMTALEGDGESIFISASEGDAALKSELLQQHFTSLNMAWGGESIIIDRADDTHTAINPRCTLSVQVQEAILSEFMQKRGESFRGSGFLARCLVTRPMSMIGYRLVQSEPPQWNHLTAFHLRLNELLEEGDLRFVAGVPRQIIEFDEDASYQWSVRANEIEAMLREGGYLCEIRDFGSKLMEHVGRVAAILHVFSRQEGKITTDTVERAFAIVWFHAEEFRLLFSPSLEIPPAVLDAEKIKRYLYQNFGIFGCATVPRNTVHRFGPVRGLDRFVPAIDILLSQNVIWITQAHRKAPLIINLNLNFFSQYVIN